MEKATGVGSKVHTTLHTTSNHLNECKVLNPGGLGEFGEVRSGKIPDSVVSRLLVHTPVTVDSETITLIPTSSPLLVYF